ncbi:MAG: hypothetical protein EZS28_013008 [Streblomastix strix]|uniref:Uncharacterized protein n=1 Tax=Streblomastix strix TaxID=222440 RepID=A0A5J4W9X5_9EUKA|nr:MAG: hypothetical protein EZS28_013008 [Streblomastix strix]
MEEPNLTASDTSEFSDTYQFSTTEAEMSENTRKRVKSQRHTLNILRRSGLRQHADIIRHSQREIVNEEDKQEEDDNKQIIIASRTYFSRSLFGSLFASQENETEEEESNRMSLWQKWLPLLDITFAKQEEYLNSLGLNDRMKNNKKKTKKKKMWRQIKIPKEFRLILRREPNPLYIAAIEARILEYIKVAKEIITKRMLDEENEGPIPIIQPLIIEENDPFNRLLARSVATYYGFQIETIAPIKHNKTLEKDKEEDVDDLKDANEKDDIDKNQDKDNELNTQLIIRGVVAVLYNLPELTLAEYISKYNTVRIRGIIKRHFKEDHEPEKSVKKKENVISQAWTEEDQEQEKHQKSAISPEIDDGHIELQNLEHEAHVVLNSLQQGKGLKGVQTNRKKQYRRRGKRN